MFGKTENQISRNSNEQKIERDSKLPELTYNLKDDKQRREPKKDRQEGRMRVGNKIKLRNKEERPVD